MNKTVSLKMKIIQFSFNQKATCVAAGFPPMI